MFSYLLLFNFNNCLYFLDYRLLEETARLVNKSVKLPPVSCHNATYGTLPSVSETLLYGVII